MAFPRLQQRVYARTEWDAPPIVPEVVPMPLDSVIRIIRPRAYADRGEFYEVFVNGAEVAIIDPDTITDISVPSGRLSVEVYADWGGSEPLMVETSPRRRVDIQVSNPWGPGLALWAKFIRPGRYLRLREVVEDVPAGHPTLAYAAHPSAVRP